MYQFMETLKKNIPTMLMLIVSMTMVRSYPLVPHQLPPSAAFSPPNHLPMYPQPGSLTVPASMPLGLSNQLPAKTISDYYSQLILNSNPFSNQQPINEPVYPSDRSQIYPVANNADDYADSNEYYEDALMANPTKEMDNLFGKLDNAQWSDSPVEVINSEVHPTKLSDDELTYMLMNYLINELEQVQTDQSSVEAFKRSGKIAKHLPPSSTVAPVTSTTTAATISPPTTAKPIHVFQRGQKEFPLLRPELDTNNPSSKIESTSADNWPNELAEDKLKEEESLQSLRTSKRSVSDIYSTELDNLRQKTLKKQ